MGTSVGGVVSGVVRFVCHIPIFMYGVGGINEYTFIQKHADILLQPPLGQIVLTAAKLSGPMGLTAAIWNFGMWIPTMFCPEQLLFFVGIVDTAITVSMITATAIESGHYGASKGQCARLPPGPDVFTSDRKLLFLQRLAMIEPDNSDFPKSHCNSHLQKYYAGVAVIILYGIASIANVLTGAFAWVDDAPFPRSRSQNRHGLITKNILFIVVIYPLYAILIILFVPTKCLISGLALFTPEPTRKRVRFSWRWVCKWASHQWISVGKTATKVYMRLRALPRRVRAKLFRGKSGHNPLIKALEVDRVALEIARHLHHIDLVNLSLSSKDVYQELYPSNTVTALDKIEKKINGRQSLRVMTCPGLAKSNCWGCGILTCRNCGTSKRVRPSVTSFHMTLCRARCSKCAITKMTTSQNARNRCCCRDGRDPTASTLGWGHTQLYENKLVCRDCAKRSDVELKVLREKRDREVYRRLVQQPMACDICSEALKRTGPIWWFCSNANCGVECKSEAHPHWGREVEV